MAKKGGFSRRDFLKGTAATVAAATAVGSFLIVPRKVLGGPGNQAPSDTVGSVLVGCGDQGPTGTIGHVREWGVPHELRAKCDVKFKDIANNKDIYTDFRRVLERKDIDLVIIATPPHWHSLISIAAMQAGKDVFCEKPMTRFVVEGQAVADAEKRYGRIFQVGVNYRMGRQGRGDILCRKIMTSGLLKNSKAVLVHKGNLKVKAWAGAPAHQIEAVPKNLDWDMYCGPSPMHPFVRQRFGGSHRQYWDYDGGGLGDMGFHNFDAPAYPYAMDTYLPVEVEAYAPPAHPEVTGMWAWAKLKYPSGFTYVVESGEWGPSSGMTSTVPGGNGDNSDKLADFMMAELSPEDQAKVKAMPDPPKLINFGEAVKTRKPSCGNAAMAHKTSCIMHYMNVAIRTGRKLKINPDTGMVLGDDEANRLVNVEMRAPWHL